MDNAISLSLARIVIGTAAWAVPEMSLKAGMLDSTAPQSPYLLRMFGAREVALGAVTLLAAPEHKPALLKLGMLVDAADTGAAVQALQKGQVQKQAGIVLAVSAASAILAGGVALKQQR